MAGTQAEAANAATVHIMRANTVIATFQVEIAETHEDKMRGLMFRKSMPKNHGMVFVHSPPTDARMWMKNTLIPLDMLFVGTEQQIVHIHHNATPHSLTPIKAGQPITAVIEINGGEARAQDIQIGDIAVITREPMQGNTQ